MGLDVTGPCESQSSDPLDKNYENGIGEERPKTLLQQFFKSRR